MHIMHKTQKVKAKIRHVVDQTAGKTANQLSFESLVKFLKGPKIS